MDGGVVEVSVGRDHACARKADGTAWCWGYNGRGQLGDGSTLTRTEPVQIVTLGTSVAQISAGGDHTCARKIDGTLWCFGRNDFGELGDGTKVDHPVPTLVTLLADQVAEVSAGDTHVCARKLEGPVWCWGRNLFGELGNGRQADQAPYVYAKPVAATMTCQ